MIDDIRSVGGDSHATTPACECGSTEFAQGPRDRHCVSCGRDAISSKPAKRRQVNRMIKLTCPDCGYLVRVARRWLSVATPRCPLHGLDMVEDLQETNV